MDTSPSRPAKVRSGAALQNVSKPQSVKRNEIETLAYHEINDKSITTMVEDSVEALDDGMEAAGRTSVKGKERELSEEQVQDQLREAMENFHKADEDWRQRSTGIDGEGTTTLSLNTFCNTVLQRYEVDEVDQVKVVESALEAANEMVAELRGKLKVSKAAEEDWKSATSNIGVELDRKRKENTDLQSRLERMEEELRTSKTGNSDNKAKIGALEAAVGRYKNKASGVTLDIKEKDEIIEQLCTNLQDEKTTRDQLERRLEEVQDQSRRDSMSYKQFRMGHHNKMSEYREQMTSNTGTYEQRLVELEREIQKIQSARANVERRNMELQDRRNEADAAFLGELQDTLGLTPEVCWETLSRLGLSIRRTTLCDVAPTTGLDINSSRLYGEVGDIKRMGSTKKIARTIVKIILGIRQGQVGAWVARLRDLWFAFEDPDCISRQTREEVFAPLLGLIRSIVDAFPNAEEFPLVLWTSCRLACNLLRYAPPTLDLEEFTKDPGWLSLKPHLLAHHGWEQVVQADEGRHHPERRHQSGHTRW